MKENTHDNHPQQDDHSDAIREEILDEIADLEEYARLGKTPPRCRGYRIRINGEKYVIRQTHITGAEVLELAGLTPAETYTLRVKKAGQRPQKVELNESVDLRCPGIEKFKALPKDQTEGFESRRQFQLPADDLQFLSDYGLPWECVNDGSHWVLMHNFPLPDGYSQDVATAAIRIETGYPATALDMVYFYPALSRCDGKPIGATQHTQTIDGKPYQRWSRHRTAVNPWIPNLDNLGTHIILIEEWLSREFVQ